MMHFKVYLLAIFAINLLPFVLCDKNTNRYRTSIDILTAEYLKVEKNLWSRLNNDKEIRPNVLPDIYEIHRDILTSEFGESGVMWELGIRLHEKIITNILQINASSSNLQETLAKKQNDSALSLAQLAVNQTADASDALFQLIVQPSFWSHISVNISHAPCTKLTDSVPTESQILFDVHSELSAALLRAYVTVQYSYMVLSVDEKENFSNKSEAYRDTFKQKYTTLQNTVRTLLKQADRRKWTCDKSNQLSTTYHQITRLVQGYIDNEINLNPDESCKATCSDYKETKQYQCSGGTLCADAIVQHSSTKCNGTILHCEFIDEDLTVCPSVHKLDSRRYDYIKYTSGKILGKEEACLQPVQAESWINWFVKCSNCFCYCDEESDLSDRFFSLRHVVSNLLENRVVTGLSIIKRNRILQLQITESILLPFGKINTTNTYDSDGKLNPYYRFVTTDEFKITDANVKDGVDYHKLTWKNRGIALDTIMAPLNKVVTGVRFNLIDDSHLALQILATDFNYETGKLENIQASEWISKFPSPKTKINLDGQDIPTKSSEYSKPDWSSNQYIDFGPTDRVRDAAQLTIPFLDALAVEGKPGPLSGAGLYFKRKTGFSGFVAPVLIDYNFEPYITEIN